MDMARKERMTVTVDAELIEEGNRAAALVLLAHDGDRIVTSDPEDIARLAKAADRHVEIIGV